MPLVNTLQAMSGISLERYIAVVPPSRNIEMPSSMSEDAFCAMTILASVLMVVFLVYASPETFWTSFTDIAPPRILMILPSSSS